MSFRSLSTIRKGRAVVLAADGTVEEMTTLGPPILGWCMSNVHPGEMASIRMMTEGTMMVEVKPLEDYFAGVPLQILSNGTVSPKGSDNVPLIGFGLTSNRNTSTGGIYIEALMLRQINLWDRPDP